LSPNLFDPATIEPYAEPCSLATQPSCHASCTALLAFSALCGTAIYDISQPRPQAEHLHYRRDGMGDPFSVAGTAVGITSLGIQTCQILYNYYSQFKGCRDDIDNVLRQVEGLQGILESLRELKSRIEIDNHAPSSQLNLALKAYEEALAKLKEIADKCNTTQQPEGIQARLRDLKKRVLWPYKKETLGEMQAVLGRFQDNIVLAVQSAGLDVVLRKVENLHPALNFLQDQTTHMEQTLCRNTNVLEVFRQDVTEVSLMQQPHNTRIFRELSDLRNELSRQTTQVCSMADLLVHNSMSSGSKR
jgi:hypothetical protein